MQQYPSGSEKAHFLWVSNPRFAAAAALTAAAVVPAAAFAAVEDDAVVDAETDAVASENESGVVETAVQLIACAYDCLDKIAGCLQKRHSSS